MPSVGTVSATIIGPGTAHGLTRVSFVNATSSVPTQSEVDAALAAMMVFWSGITGNVVAGTVITPQDAAVVRDVATGLTIDEVPATTIPPPVTMTDTSPDFVSGTGGRVDWRTGVRRGSREVRGATFVIPMGSGQFSGSGNLTGACVTSVQNAASAMIAAFNSSLLIQVVYGRPLPATTHHGALAGITAQINHGSVSNVPAFLRRRRE